MRRGRRWAAAAVLGAWSTSCSGAFGMPRGATEQGQQIFDLWRIFFFASIPVAGVVYGLILWSVLRYRRRRSEDPRSLGAQFRASIPLEIAYTAIPIAIVIGLFTASVVVQQRVSELDPTPDVTLGAQAFSWGWRFTYEGDGVTIVSPPSGESIAGPQILFPLGGTVRVVLTSADVIHAFWVPGFLYKHDAIPGRTFRFDVTPTRIGTFVGECAEFCGLNHAYMTFSVRVVEPATFDAWLARERAAQAATG